MNPRHELHIRGLSTDDLLGVIQNSEFEELTGAIDEFQINGNDLLDLKEYDVLRKFGNNDKRKLFLSFLNNVQSTPEKLFPLKPTLKPKPLFARPPSTDVTHKEHTQGITSELNGKFANLNHQNLKSSLSDPTNKKTTGPPVPTKPPLKRQEQTQSSLPNEDVFRKLSTSNTSFELDLDDHDEESLEIIEGSHESVDVELNKIYHEIIDDNMMPSADKPPPLPERPSTIKFTELIKIPNVIEQREAPLEVENLETSAYMDPPRLLDDSSSRSLPFPTDTYGELPGVPLVQPELPPEPFEDDDITPENALRRNIFFRKCSRSEGVRLLETKRIGAFLLRPSSQPQFHGVLMIHGVMLVQNIPIIYDTDINLYYLAAATKNMDEQSRRFKSLHALINYYTNHPVNGEFLLNPMFNDLD